MNFTNNFLAHIFKKSELISAVCLAGWLGALDIRTGKR
jgi:hypothetical protein